MVGFCPLFCLLWKQRPLIYQTFEKVEPKDANSLKRKESCIMCFYPLSLSLLPLSTDCWSRDGEVREMSAVRRGVSIKELARGQHRGALHCRRKREWEKERVGQKRKNGWYKVHTLFLFLCPVSFFTLYITAVIEDWHCVSLGHDIDKLLFYKSVQNLW